MKILVTGTAGFIGFHLVNRLLERGDEVVGIDSINDYYDVNLKYGRLEQAGIRRSEAEKFNIPVTSTKHSKYKFIRMQIEDRDRILHLFQKEKFDVVMNLAAQPGARHSVDNPGAYVDSNLVGYVNILEGCRLNAVKHFVFASSSSVYGLNENMPFSTGQNVDHPISLYAASKKSNELIAHVYSHLYNLPTTGLRFFTVYGPWGRPDMAQFLFTKAIIEDRPIDVFNNGDMKRDFTYIDDIVEGIVRVIDHKPSGNVNWSGSRPEPDTSLAPYRIYNIGNNKPVSIMEFIEAIESKLNKKAVKNFLSMQPGDVHATWADASDLMTELGYAPNTPIEVGISNFVDWYKKFYQIID